MEQFDFFEEFFLNKWDSLDSFLNDLQQKNQQGLFLQGYARVERVKKTESGLEKDTLLVLKINDELYALIVRCDKKDKSLYFDGVASIVGEFLKSKDYLNIVRRSALSKFVELKIGVPVDIKVYNYENEQLLNISQVDKVNLLYSIKLFLDSNENFNYKCDVSPSLIKIADWYRFNADTMSRLKEMGK